MRTTLIAILALIVIVAAVYFVTGFAMPAGTGSASSITFYCADAQTIEAVFSTSSVALTLSDGRSFTLPQTESGSGIRYEATTTGADGEAGTDAVFSSEGADAYLTENGQTTYENCTAANIASASASGYDTYTDQAGSFTFTFPTAFSVAGSEPGYSTNWSALATTSGQVLATLAIPSAYEPGTNFGDARFTVGTSADPTAVATCLDNPSGNPSGSTVSATVDGLPFVKMTYGDVGAGNYYDTTSYRIVRDNQCYAVEYTIHYANIENYPPGAVKQFDEASLASALDQVALSFRFLQ